MCQRGVNWFHWVHRWAQLSARQSAALLQQLVAASSLQDPLSGLLARRWLSLLRSKLLFHQTHRRQLCLLQYLRLHLRQSQHQHPLRLRLRGLKS